MSLILDPVIVFGANMFDQLSYTDVLDLVCDFLSAWTERKASATYCQGCEYKNVYASFPIFKEKEWFMNKLTFN